MADVAVIAKDYRSRTSGVAFALGEQPLKSFHSVRNMVRLSLGEALTNLVFGNVMRYGDIHLVLSFNCAGKLRGETARMYECCEEVKEAVMALGLEVVNVKDSVSMAVHMENETVKVRSRSPLDVGPTDARGDRLRQLRGRERRRDARHQAQRAGQQAALHRLERRGLPAGRLSDL